MTRNGLMPENRDARKTAIAVPTTVSAATEPMTYSRVFSRTPGTCGSEMSCR